VIYRWNDLLSICVDILMFDVYLTACGKFNLSPYQMVAVYFTYTYQIS
jgi:hypothetical protein